MEVHILLFVFKQDVYIEMERTRYGGHELARQERRGGCCREQVREIRCCWLRGKVQGSGGLESGGRFWRNV